MLTSGVAQIDWQESQLKSQACVRRGVDADLDKLRRQYDGLESFLVQSASTAQRRPRRH